MGHVMYSIEGAGFRRMRPAINPDSELFYCTVYTGGKKEALCPGRMRNWTGFWFVGQVTAANSQNEAGNNKPGRTLYHSGNHEGIQAVAE